MSNDLSANSADGFYADRLYREPPSMDDLQDREAQACRWYNAVAFEVENIRFGRSYDKLQLEVLTELREHLGRQHREAQRALAQAKGVTE